MCVCAFIKANNILLMSNKQKAVSGQQQTTGKQIFFIFSQLNLDTILPASFYTNE